MICRGDQGRRGALKAGLGISWVLHGRQVGALFVAGLPAIPGLRGARTLLRTGLVILAGPQRLRGARTLFRTGLGKHFPKHMGFNYLTHGKKGPKN